MGCVRIARACCRRKAGSEISESHCLETHWERRRGFGGSLSRIFVTRLSSLATATADGEEGEKVSSTGMLR